MKATVSDCIGVDGDFTTCMLRRYAHIFESPSDVTVVMEYFNGGDLFQWVGY